VPAIALRNIDETTSRDESSHITPVNLRRVFVPTLEQISSPDKANIGWKPIPIDFSTQELSSSIDARQSIEAFRARTLFVSAPKSSFVAIAEWEGNVVDIGENGFTAQLVTKTESNIAQTFATQETDFQFDDLDEDDRDLVQKGALFRWVIGYSISPSGGRIRGSRVKFRRLPAYTKRELESAQEMAKYRSNKIRWE